MAVHPAGVKQHGVSCWRLQFAVAASPRSPSVNAAAVSMPLLLVARDDGSASLFTAISTAFSQILQYGGGCVAYVIFSLISTAFDRCSINDYLLTYYGTVQLLHKQVRNVLWTRNGVRATAVTAGHCKHAELISGHALDSCYSCCVHSIPGLC